MKLSTDSAAALEWLATAREPRSTQEIWDELTLRGHREPPDGLPRTVGILANAMLDLCLKGHVVERDGRWEIVRQKVAKAERTLF